MARSGYRSLLSGLPLYTQGVPSYSEFKKQQNEGQKILWHKEGVNANVAVRESQFGDTIQKTLVINGKADASTLGDLQTQILLGQIPLMLCPNTGDALVIGLGSGITCGSALSHPIKSLDVVEISSEVVECNYLFAKENNNFMADDRVKIYIDDAITQLKTATKKYDYIISEPSNPWIAGIGNLYSVEFFNSCKARLNTNGVLTQWFHTYDVNNDIFRLVMSTISHVFPFVTIWKASDADLIILASATPLFLDFDALQRKVNQPEIAGDLARIKMYDIPTLLSTQVISARNNPFADVKNELNTAEKSALEFMAPVPLFTHESVTMLDSLDERFTFQDKNLWFSEYGKSYELSFENYMNIARYRSASHIGDRALAWSALRTAVEMDAENDEVRTLLSKTARDLGLPDVNLRKSQLDELRTLAEASPCNNSVIFQYLNALVEYYRIDNSIVNPQHMDDAVELMKRSIQFSPGNEAQFRFILAMILTGAGRYDEAAEAFKVLLQFQHQNGTGAALLTKNELIFNIGESWYNAGNLDEAESYFKRLQPVSANADKLMVMQRKTARKKAGFK